MYHVKNKNLVSIVAVQIYILPTVLAAGQELPLLLELPKGPFQGPLYRQVVHSMIVAFKTIKRISFSHSLSLKLSAFCLWILSTLLTCYHLIICLGLAHPEESLLITLRWTD